ncbi:MAG TPA: carboxypeptidase regulatory-like domain-containing protein [Longimicrobiaceae bacterium]|nr:carboxypeptidase regulatory-like domain-containing protein [Longimicrobiaceae bacterium]
MSSWKISLLVVSLLLGAPALAAQAIRGELVDAAGNRPVPGTLVVLLDASGRQVEGGLTDAEGRVLLRAPAPGRYTLRAERVGWGSVVSPVLELTVGRSVEHRLVMPAQMVRLEGIVVQGERRRCTLVAEAGRQTAALWEEARKALNAAAWTEQRRPFRVEVVRYSRTLDPTTLRVESERTSRRSGLSTSPFGSYPAEKLVEEGFVRAVGDSVDYHGPDAHVLLSDAFLETHCFRVQEGSGETEGLTGLAFEPVRGRRLPDVRGVLWMDPRKAELRHLEYSYTGLDLRGPTDGIGGRIEFERLPSGEWLIPRWRIRVPLVEVERIQDGLNWTERRRVTRLQEEAGVVAELRTLAGGLVRSRERAALEGTVFDSTRAVPLAGARVRLAVARRETTLAPLVVTAESARDRAARTSAVARAVFNREELEQLDRGATQLVGDVLRRIPGVNVRELYYDQTQSRSSICIENRREVMGPTRAIPCAMIVMDDIPLRHGLGLRELVTLRLREIESIEYLAPLSARTRHGKDAEGGVVVIYTLGKGPHARDRPTPRL